MEDFKKSEQQQKNHKRENNQIFCENVYLQSNNHPSEITDTKRLNNQKINNKRYATSKSVKIESKDRKILWVRLAPNTLRK